MTRRPIRIRVATSLRAEPSAVWASVSTMTGVNFELGPYVKMTRTREHEVLPVDVTAGQVLFRSWLLLFGFIPFDRHALALDRVDDGIGFVEESTSWLQRRWRHERSLREHPAGGCVIEDRLVVDPRVSLVRPVVEVVVQRLFEHRHRRLIARFGATSTCRDPHAADTEPTSGQWSG